MHIHRASRKLAACVCVGMWILHRRAVAKTHLGGHTRAHRMDRRQKFASQTVPLSYLAAPDPGPDPDPDSAVACLSRRWIQFKMGLLSPLYWLRGARKGHLLSQGTWPGKRGGSSPARPMHHSLLIQWLSNMNLTDVPDNFPQHLLNPCTAHTTGEPYLILASPIPQLCSSLTLTSSTQT